MPLTLRGGKPIFQGGGQASIAVGFAVEQALTTLEGLYRYAADSEAGAVETYGGFAEKCADARVHDVFMAIVREESEHLTVLLNRLEQMK